MNPRRAVSWAVAVGGTSLLGALAATWPLAARLSTAIPLGAEREATVPIFSLWTLWWTAERAAHGFVGYWDAPFFHPQRGVLALSEPQTLAGLLVAPLWTLGAAPATVYNVALLALLTANGVFVCRLLRACNVPPAPALLGGLLGVTLPFVARNLGVLPVLPIFGIPWILDGLVRFGRTGRARHAVVSAAGILTLYLASEQLALLFAPFAGGAVVLAASEQGFRARAVAWLGLAVAVAGGGILLLSAPARQVHAELGLRRPEAVVQALSAHPRDFLVRPATALTPLPRRAETSLGDTAGLFPGWIVLGLALAGTAAGWRRDGLSRRWTAYLAATTLVAGLLALGLNLTLGPWRPFALLRDTIPGLDRLRSPFRFVVVQQLCLVVLAGLGLAALGRRLPRRSRAILVGLLAALGAMENLSLPGKLADVPLTPRTAWTGWLAQQPETTVVAHIPFPASLHVSGYEPEAWRLFHQIDHGKPLLNGYASYFPPGYSRFQLVMSQRFPDRKLLCALAGPRLRTTLLIVDRAWEDRHAGWRDAVDVRPLVEPAYGDGEVQIYRLTAAAAACGPTE